jgi:hypothetical protein
VAYRGNSPQAANVRDSFLRKLPQLYNMAFFGDHLRKSFGRSLKAVPELPQWKTNFNFYIRVMQKLMYYRLTSILGL